MLPETIRHSQVFLNTKRRQQPRMKSLHFLRFQRDLRAFLIPAIGGDKRRKSPDFAAITAH
jgi:hypothetical protein